MNNYTIDSLEIDAFEEMVNSYDPNQIVILADENTVRYADFIHQVTDLNIDVIQLPCGEDYKTINTVAGIWNDLTNQNFRRDGLIINLGGGVITDMGGFAAATYKRGVDFINIPTTLLSMVDAAIGGKTGVDFQDFKNQVGVIKDAKHVFCDVTFFKTLPKEEMVSGFAEVLKHGLITDKKYWDYCTETTWEDLDWKKVVEGSIDIKSKIVNEDPFEKGVRRLLNFGHTIGHAIESTFLENLNPLLHGYAVAAGMICEAHLSFQKDMLSEEDLNSIVKVLNEIYPKIVLDKEDTKALLPKMKNDKKNISDEINFSLLNGIGKATYNCTASAEQISTAISYYKAL